MPQLGAFKKNPKLRDMYVHIHVCIPLMYSMCTCVHTYIYVDIFYVFRQITITMVIYLSTTHKSFVEFVFDR